MGYSVWLISDLGYAPYLLDPSLSQAHDNRNAIRWNDGSLGGLRPLKTLGLRFANSSQIFDPYSTVKIGSGLIVERDIIGKAVSIRLAPDAIAPVESYSNLIDDTGNILMTDDGQLIVAG